MSIGDTVDASGPRGDVMVGKVVVDFVHVECITSDGGSGLRRGISVFERNIRYEKKKYLHLRTRRQTLHDPGSHRQSLYFSQPLYKRNA